jgi:hypothetical protein
MDIRRLVPAYKAISPPQFKGSAFGFRSTWIDVQIPGNTGSKRADQKMIS